MDCFPLENLPIVELDLVWSIIVSARTWMASPKWMLSDKGSDHFYRLMVATSKKSDESIELADAFQKPVMFLSQKSGIVSVASNESITSLCRPLLWGVKVTIATRVHIIQLQSTTALWPWYLLAAFIATCSH